MSLYKRGAFWWFEFVFAGQRVRESTKETSKTVAKRVEEDRKRQLREGARGDYRPGPLLFRTAAASYIERKEPHVRPRSLIIEKANLKHLLPTFGNKLQTDISAEEVARYQTARLARGAAPKTVNLELGTLRAILRHHQAWSRLAGQVKPLKVAEDVGRAITHDEEHTLLRACSESRSIALAPAVAVLLHAGLRHEELLSLTWRDVELGAKVLRVPKSKTEAGTGRRVPLDSTAAGTLTMWAARFPDQRQEHYVFPHEDYGYGGARDADPTRPFVSLRSAWRTARVSAGLPGLRLHDLRHTWVTRLLSAGVSFPVVATLAGWSPSTAIRMAKRYGHLSDETLRLAVEKTEIRPESTQNAPQSAPETRTH